MGRLALATGALVAMLPFAVLARAKTPAAQGRAVAAQASSAPAVAPTPPPPAPTPSPTAAATPNSAPTVAPTPQYRFVYRATPAPEATPFPGPGAPQILEIDLSDQYLLTPGRLDARVVTNPEVQSVTAETFGYTLEVPKIAPGLFGGSWNVGEVPAMVKNRLFDITIAATATNGRRAEVVLQLGLK
jgi:hypothetical protein